MSYGAPTKEQIEAARGYFFVKPLSPNPSPINGRGELRKLSAAEQAEVAKNRELVRLHIPEMEAFVKELYEAGMIDGWRSVGKVVFRDIGGQDGIA